MKWTREAEEAVKRVPFFVRKKVRARIEKETREAGQHLVSIREVRLAKKRFLSGMEKDIEGFRVESCFGTSGCPNRAMDTEELVSDIGELFKKEKMLDFIRNNVDGPLKYHHEFRVTIAECPNACSQPQIRDIGIIGALKPTVSEEIQCISCGECVETCAENAVSIDGDKVSIARGLCVGCGQCVRVCPSGTLREGSKGFRVLLGGKLGRHPVLAKELPGIFTRDQVVRLVEDCIRYYKKNALKEERFASLVHRIGYPAFLKQILPEKTNTHET